MISPLKLSTLLLAIALVVAMLHGCGGDSEELATIRPGPVSEFRLEAMERAHAVDTGIAALEEKRVTADSATGAAFQRTINELLEARRVLQEGLGSLDTLTTAEFELVTDSLSTQLDFLERRVDRAVFELAPDLEAVREAVRERLAALNEGIDELKVGADSTMVAALSALAQRSEALSDSASAASEGELERLRRTIAGDLRLLRTTLDSLRFEQAADRLAADSTNAD